jgi:hypothetical protein
MVYIAKSLNWGLVAKSGTIAHKILGLLIFNNKFSFLLKKQYAPVSTFNCCICEHLTLNCCSRHNLTSTGLLSGGLHRLVKCSQIHNIIIFYNI